MQEQLDKQKIEEGQQIEAQDIPTSLDDKRLYNLPQKTKLIMNEQYHQIRKHLFIQKQNFYSEQVRKLASEIDNIFESHLYSWKEDNKWSFNLPKTVFQEQQSPIQFFKPGLVYGDQDMSNITPQQMASIKQTGKFVIYGKNEDSSKEWKINPWIVRGKDYINKRFYKGVSNSYSQLLQIRKRIGWKYAVNYGLASQLIKPNFFNGFISISCVAAKLLAITIGTKSVNYYTENQILSEIIRERNQETIIQNQSTIKTNFFEFITKKSDFNSHYRLSEKQKLEMKYAVEDLNFLNQQFVNSANELEKSRKSQLQSNGVEESEALLQIFQEKQQLLFNIIQSSYYIQDKQVQDHLIELIKASQIAEKHYYELKNNLKEYSIQLEKDLEENHPIKYNINSWKQDKINESIKIKKPQLLKKCNEKIIKELEQNKLDSFTIQFQRFVDFQVNQEKIYEENYERIQNSNTKPSRIFETYEYNKKPYKVLSYVQQNGETFYYFDQMKSHQTPTSFLGWRLALLQVRCKVYTKNIYQLLIENIINGQFGLKTLFKKEPFPGNYKVDLKNGQLIQEYAINPYIYTLKQSLKNIKKSIQDFEASPDRGILGKSFARIFKYIESLVSLFFSLTFKGIGMPVVIITNITLSFLLAITSWVWVPCFLLLRQIFNLLIYDLDHPFNLNLGKYQRYQTKAFLPLVNIILDIASGIYQLTMSLACALTIHPSLSILSFATSSLMRQLSTLRDNIMCGLISAVGRQPEIDTFLAWKVGKTGEQPQQFYYINIEDSKFLVRAHLEKIELEEYKKRLLEKINEPKQIYEDLSKELFRFYEIGYADNRIITSSINLYTDILNEQIGLRVKNYPKIPNCHIRLTEEELNNLFYQSCSIIESFIESRKMDWIYQKYEIKSKDSIALTEKLLIEIFNNPDILYHIEELSKRVDLKTEKGNNYDQVYKVIQKERIKINTQNNNNQNLIQKEIQRDRITQELQQKKFIKYKQNELFPFVDIKQILINFEQKKYQEQNDFTKSSYSVAHEAFNFDFEDYLKIVNQNKSEQQENKN